MKLKAGNLKFTKNDLSQIFFNDFAKNFNLLSFINFRTTYFDEHASIAAFVSVVEN